MNNEIPFPQADDFDKVYKLIKIPDENLLSDFDYVAKYLGNITDRQVSYYLSAAMYLGLISRDKNITSLGNKIRRMSNRMQVAELIKLLLSDEIILNAYVYDRVTGMQISSSQIEEMIKDKHPDYSDSICKRRAQTVLSWAAWIIEQCI